MGKLTRSLAMVAFVALLLAMSSMQSAFGLDHWTVGSQGPYQNGTNYKIGTKAMLYANGQTVSSAGAHVSSIYARYGPLDYVETGYCTKPAWGWTRKAFFAWEETSDVGNQHRYSYNSAGYGEWNYFELNRYGASGSEWNWRSNTNGYQASVVVPMNSGQPYSSSERETYNDTNWHYSANLCYKETNGGWYKFTDCRASSYQDSGWYGHWGAFWPQYGGRDFNVDPVQ